MRHPVSSEPSPAFATQEEAVAALAAAGESSLGRGAAEPTATPALAVAEHSRPVDVDVRPRVARARRHLDPPCHSEVDAVAGVAAVLARATRRGGLQPALDHATDT